MTKRRKLPRWVIILIVTGAIAASVLFLMMPKPQEVDLGQVERKDLAVTITEEARTAVRDSFVVSTPVAGRLMRVQLNPGDEVAKGDTVVARMLPTNPTVLDSRTREQAVAAVDAATAAVRLARANFNAATAVEELSQSELDRTLSLFEREIVSKAALDRAESAHRANIASRETAEAAIAMREAELANAQANLISRDDVGLANAIAGPSRIEIPLYSPIDGRVLRVNLESETVVPAGTPILEIGNIAADLEVNVQLISSDAVKVDVGDQVILSDWGGPKPLSGKVIRVDPFGVTKVSALAIEEQRVNVEIEITSPPEDRERLGHGYRLEAGIIIWNATDVLVVPSSALFREDDRWFAFAATDGSARKVEVEIGNSDGLHTEVTSGLARLDQVILYPSAAITDGSTIVERRAD